MDTDMATSAKLSKMLIAFCDVLRHFIAYKRQDIDYIQILDWIAVILVVKLKFWVNY